MEVLVNRRTARKVVVRERHILRVKKASMPTRQALDDREAVCIQKRYGSLPRQNTLINQNLNSRIAGSRPSAYCSLPTPKYFNALSAAAFPIRMQSEMPIPE